MSSKEWIAQQRRKVNELVNLFPQAVQTVHTSSMERIYEDGYLSERGNFKYEYNDTTPVYIDPDDAPRSFQPQGKPRRVGTKKVSGLKTSVRRRVKAFNTSFVANVERKTKYFRSYKAFRAAMGRETSFVNLDLNGLQRRDNSTSLSKLSANRWATGFKNHANTLKWKGQVDKYGEYHKLTEGEHTQLRQLIADQRKKLAV